MAYNNNGSAAPPLCRYFASGCCSRDDCFFLHDRSARPDNVCRYYLLGQCFYGDGCRYDHVVPDRDIATSRGASGLPDQPNKENRSGAIPKYPRFPAASKTGREGNGYQEEKLIEPYVPPSSYAQAVDKSSGSGFVGQNFETNLPPSQQLCQYALTGICPIGDECEYFHGAVCEICQCQVLDPLDANQRSRHEKICTEALERDMEFSFAVQRSEGKVCSICMDNVLDKGEIQKQRFGILQNCGHTFCFDCIMNWRKQSKETLDSTTLRSCPECRIHSDYVVPSKLWPETKEERDNVIKKYKTAMGKKPCRHFENGIGKCPFGGSCWFLHALADGTKINLPAPKPRRKLFGADGMASMFLDSYHLSDYLDFSDDDDDDDKFGLDEEPDCYDGIDVFYDAYDSDVMNDSEDESVVRMMAMMLLNGPSENSADGHAETAYEIPSQFNEFNAMQEYHGVSSDVNGTEANGGNAQRPFDNW